MLMQLPSSLALCISASIGLAVGSFLNVVIYRLPLMLQADWQAQCRDFLTLPPIPKQQAFNLLTPASHCRACQKPLPWFTNIPLFSYLFLKGKCLFCQQRISLRYPLVEITCALLTGWLVWHYGITWQALAVCIFTWLLLGLVFIDLDYQILPDNLLLPLTGLGLGLSLSNFFTTPSAAIIGLLAGYLSLWLVTMLFKLCTGKEGMGSGDFKLLAALGAWCGWQLLPLILFIASALGSLIGISLVLAGKHHYQQPLAFGPYLAIAGWISLIYGHNLIHWYLFRLI
jgi:leader peptidase (prepilin peptidase)/N-methyltransferase